MMTMTDQIKYRAGYKYQLAVSYTVQTNIIGYSAKTQFLKLHLSGELTIKAGYAWDGPSGPAFDTEDFMRGSLVHDALYDLIRRNIISGFERDQIDKLLRDMCIEDGMEQFRAAYVYKAVNVFGRDYADPESKREVFIAPGGEDDR
jgi:hypothetical protein